MSPALTVLRSQFCGLSVRADDHALDDDLEGVRHPLVEYPVEGVPKVTWRHHVMVGITARQLTVDAWVLNGAIFGGLPKYEVVLAIVEEAVDM